MNPVLPTLQLSGVAGPAEQQARYFQLMKQGWNNNDACRAVGVCRKTGTRWRLGRTETREWTHPLISGPRNGQHDWHLGTVSVRKRTLPDRRFASGREQHAVHRRGIGSCRVDDQPRTAAQPRPSQRRVPATHREPPRGDPPASAQKRPGSPPTRCSGSSSTVAWPSATARNRSATS